MSGLQLAIKLAEEKFENMVDKGGNCYMEHLRFVSDHGRNETEKIIGMLHDILENTTVTHNELIDMGFSESIVKKILLLTKNEDISYKAYIDQLIASHDVEALFIKKIDMENNMDLKRLAVVTSKDIERVNKKYKPNYIRICKALEKLETLKK